MAALPVIYGLVLAGGASKRMGGDKAALRYGGRPQLQRACELLDAVCERIFVSVRHEQRDDPTRAGLPQIVDLHNDIGPIAGIAAAQTRHPEAAWLVMACDLPFVSGPTLRYLIAHRDPSRLATVFRSTHDGLPEPLCAIWEPSSHAAVKDWIAAGKQCPRKLLLNSSVALLDQPEPGALDNVNTPEEYRAAQEALNAQPIRIHVQYFAVFREQAGVQREIVETRASTAASLYEELRRRHSFKLAPSQLKVAINAEFRDWQSPLANNDQVAFIPPVAGG